MSTPENIPSVGPDAPDPRWSEPETEPHAAPATPADEVVLERLREAMASVPGAGSVAALAKAAFAFRTMEAELAELESVDPETVAQGDLVGAERFRGEPRVLVFRTGPQQTEQTEQTEDGGSLGDARSPGWIEVEHVDGELVGQLTPPAEVDLVVETPDGTSTSTAVDELGCFIVALPAPGPVRLRLEGAGLRIVTDWVVIR